jgi:hypothetical protein
MLAEQPVRTAAVNEVNPAAATDAGGEYVAWAQNSRAAPKRYNAFIQHGTEPRIKLNTAGQGWIGGISYPRVVYQQIVSGQSNLKLFDLATGIRSNPPTAVNSSKWEWHPTISGDWLFFNRDDNATPTQRVILFNTATLASTLLDVVTRSTHFLMANQVNGNFVVWTKCAPVCNVFKRDIAAGTTTRLAKPSTSPPRDQYAAAVTSTGTVYLARSGRTCGASVRLVRFGPTDPATGTIVAALPSGRDMWISFARENADGSTDVFHDRVTCATERWDIYKIADPAPAPRPLLERGAFDAPTADGGYLEHNIQFRQFRPRG